jgi:hypothetical protein
MCPAGAVAQAARASEEARRRSVRMRRGLACDFRHPKPEEAEFKEEVAPRRKVLAPEEVAEHRENPLFQPELRQSRYGVGLGGRRRNHVGSRSSSDLEPVAVNPPLAHSGRDALWSNGLGVAHTQNDILLEAEVELGEGMHFRPFKAVPL